MNVMQGKKINNDMEDEIVECTHKHRKGQKEALNVSHSPTCDMTLMMKT